MKGGYFLFNGQFHKESDAVFALADLSARTVGFSDVFRAEHNEILFPLAISAHLIATAETIGLEISGIIGPDGRLLRKDVSRLLNKNKLFLAARIRIQIYPSGDRINCILAAEEIERGYYPLNEPGLLLSFQNDQLNEGSKFSIFKSDQLFVGQGTGWLCEDIINGSFAFLNGDRVIFPSAGTFGTRCSIRNEVIQSVKESGFQIEERDEINSDDLLEADELFLYDACSGIQKVLGLKDRRYFSPKTRLIAEKLSERAKMGKYVEI